MDKLPKPIELTELIGKLRTDLEAAMTEGEGRRLKFKVEMVELELKVTATRTADVKGGIEFWVLSAGGSGKVESENVQSIKVRLAPQLPEPGPGGNRDVLVSQPTAEVPR